MNTAISAIPRERYVGQIGEIQLRAVEQLTGEVADLSSKAYKELLEIHFVPEFTTEFSKETLDAAAMTEKDLLDHCSDVVMRSKVLHHFFLKLKEEDAVWHFTIKRTPDGIVVSVIVGHRSAIQLALDHGFLPEIIDAEQRTVRRFAFGHTATR